MTTSNAFGVGGTIAGVLILEDGFTLLGLAEIQAIDLGSAKFVESIGAGIHLVSFVDKESILEIFPYTPQELEMKEYRESRGEKFEDLPYQFCKELRNSAKSRESSTKIVSAHGWGYMLANFE